MQKEFLLHLDSIKSSIIDILKKQMKLKVKWSEWMPLTLVT